VELSRGRVDLRGHGESDKPHGAYSYDEFNDDLVFLCNELGLDRPIAMGHSFGWQQPA
jgi:pimeloyl-ACP methyl ester carboxylesterase